MVGICTSACIGLLCYSFCVCASLVGSNLSLGILVTNGISEVRFVSLLLPYCDTGMLNPLVCWLLPWFHSIPDAGLKCWFWLCCQDDTFAWYNLICFDWILVAGMGCVILSCLLLPLWSVMLSSWLLCWFCYCLVVVAWFLGYTEFWFAGIYIVLVPLLCYLYGPLTCYPIVLG
jgi:hypothetical protein